MAAACSRTGRLSLAIDPETVVAGATAQMALDTLGRDILTFLAASVVVVPVSRALKITPVLGFLALGCAIGPYGLEVFSDTEADIELGDFGILFLLFIEGLNLSDDRLQRLGSFFKLGAAQLLLSIAAFFFATLLVGPQLLPLVETFIPLDDNLLRPILSSPVEAFCIAAAGALSSSAFVLPVLKQKGWEERADGTAALAVLLLQDLAVAPLLVILPLVAGSGPQSSSELGILVAKATFGFGGVLALGSVVLRRIFEVVASSRSSESFVAAVSHSGGRRNTPSRRRVGIPDPEPTRHLPPATHAGAPGGRRHGRRCGGPRPLLDDGRLLRWCIACGLPVRRAQSRSSLWLQLEWH